MLALGCHALPCMNPYVMIHVHRRRADRLLSVPVETPEPELSIVGPTDSGSCERDVAEEPTGMGEGQNVVGKDLFHLHKWKPTPLRENLNASRANQRTENFVLVARPEPLGATCIPA